MDNSTLCASKSQVVVRYLVAWHTLNRNARRDRRVEVPSADGAEPLHHQAACGVNDEVGGTEKTRLDRQPSATEEIEQRSMLKRATVARDDDDITEVPTLSHFSVTAKGYSAMNIYDIPMIHNESGRVLNPSRSEKKKTQILCLCHMYREKSHPFKSESAASAASESQQNVKASLVANIMCGIKGNRYVSSCSRLRRSCYPSVS